MELQVRIRMNERLFLRDPEETALGRKIIRESIAMIHSLGFEDFTFKKLATRIETTEASVYRYFENKHNLLVYLLAWYWSLLEYNLIYETKNLASADKKIRKLIELLLNEQDGEGWADSETRKALHRIAILESNKAYLTRQVTENNRALFYKPYKDLCGRIAGLLLEYNPDFPFARSLASTLVESAHLQAFFQHNLPSLTDFGKQKNNEGLKKFLESLVFSSIRKRK